MLLEGVAEHQGLTRAARPDVALGHGRLCTHDGVLQPHLVRIPSTHTHTCSEGARRRRRSDARASLAKLLSVAPAAVGPVCPQPALAAAERRVGFLTGLCVCALGARRGLLIGRGKAPREEPGSAIRSLGAAARGMVQEGVRKARVV